METKSKTAETKLNGKNNPNNRSMQRDSRMANRTDWQGGRETQDKYVDEMQV